MMAAMAEAEKIKLVEAEGNADAEEMVLKSDVYKLDAMLNLMLDTLPKVAAEVAAPLSKTDEIVILGDDRFSGEVIPGFLSQLLPTVNALTGVDLTKVLGKVPVAQKRQFKHNLPVSHFPAAKRVNHRSLSKMKTKVYTFQEKGTR